MKEQPIEVGRSTVDNWVGQRPINETYEPPNPIPQFRARPRLQQAQPPPPPTKRPAYPTITKKLAQAAPPEVSADSKVANSKKK